MLVLNDDELHIVEKIIESHIEFARIEHYDWETRWFIDKSRFNSVELNILKAVISKVIPGNYNNLEISTILRNSVVPSNQYGSGGGWHRDTRLQNEYKVFIYLSDVNSNNGPLEIITGSEKKLSIWSLSLPFEIFFKRPFQYFNTLLSKKSTKVLGKRGTIFFANVRAIHRGSPVVYGTREAITFYLE